MERAGKRLHTSLFWRLMVEEGRFKGFRKTTGIQRFVEELGEERKETRGNRLKKVRGNRVERPGCWEGSGV